MLQPACGLLISSTLVHEVECHRSSTLVLEVARHNQCCAELQKRQSFYLTLCGSSLYWIGPFAHLPFISLVAKPTQPVTAAVWHEHDSAAGAERPHLEPLVDLLHEEDGIPHRARHLHQQRRLPGGQIDLKEVPLANPQSWYRNGVVVGQLRQRLIAADVAPADVAVAQRGGRRRSESNLVLSPRQSGACLPRILISCNVIFAAIPACWNHDCEHQHADQCHPLLSRCNTLQQDESTVRRLSMNRPILA